MSNFLRKPLETIVIFLEMSYKAAGRQCGGLLLRWLLWGEDLWNKPLREEDNPACPKLELFDLFIERIQTCVAFGWLSERPGEKTLCPRTFWESSDTSLWRNTATRLANRTMPSPYQVFLWRENEESMFWSFHPLADKTNNEHLPKPYFKVMRNLLFKLGKDILKLKTFVSDCVSCVKNLLSWTEGSQSLISFKAT